MELAGDELVDSYGWRNGVSCHLLSFDEGVFIGGCELLLDVEGILVSVRKESQARSIKTV